MAARRRRIRARVGERRAIAGDAVSLERRIGCGPRSSAAAATLPAADGALFRGLVIGDDRDQPREMIDRFRASGLSHLTAVSGQNVSFVLAAAGPLLRRLRPWMRWAVTLALIAWFVALRGSNRRSCGRGRWRGCRRRRSCSGASARRSGSWPLAVTGLVLVDPLLVVVGRVLAVGRRDARGERGRTMDRGPLAGSTGRGSWRCRSA